MARWTFCLVVLAVIFCATPVQAQILEESQPLQPYTDCTPTTKLDDCYVCCGGHAAAAKGACIGAGGTESFCQGQFNSVYSDCLNRACGRKSGSSFTPEQFGQGLFALLNQLEVSREAQPESPEPDSE